MQAPTAAPTPVSAATRHMLTVTVSLVLMHMQTEVRRQHPSSLDHGDTVTVTVIWSPYESFLHYADDDKVFSC